MGIQRGGAPQCVNVLICQCANALRHKNTPAQTQRSLISTLAHQHISTLNYYFQIKKPRRRFCAAKQNKQFLFLRVFLRAFIKERPSPDDQRPACTRSAQYFYVIYPNHSHLFPMAGTEAFRLSEQKRSGCRNRSIPGAGIEVFRLSELFRLP